MSRRRADGAAAGIEPYRCMKFVTVRRTHVECYVSKPDAEDRVGHHRQLGSLQLLLGVKQGLTSSFPQIFFPARLGFLL